MSYSYRSIIDGGADSEIIYYNANIINVQQNNAENAADAPPVRFNESRDAPIIKDASRYNFSIIRFAMNGPNKTLPLFIPLIQTNGFGFPITTDPNRTIYYLNIAYQRNWTFTNTSGAAQTKTFTIAPESVPIIYRPEIQNQLIAPTPIAPVTGFDRQNIANKYYWVYTYKHWATLVNETFLSAMDLAWSSFQATWLADPDIDLAASPFPYTTFASFLLDHDVPFIKYDENTRLFDIYGDTRAFNVASQLAGINDPITGLPLGTNVPLPAFVPPAIPAPPFAAQPATSPYLRLFFNANLYGLFTNFNTTLFNAITNDTLTFPLTGSTPIRVPTNLTAVTPTCYTYEILFSNQNYTNILNNNPTLQGNSAVPPPAYNPYFLIPPQKQRTYWIARQDYNSTGSQWSPCQSIVFTSTLLPIKKEYTGKPIVLGTNNVSASQGSQSAFEPIIADFVIDQQYEKAEGWRDFTLYEPTAEYKMISLTASHDEIRNIDIQVFWKYRLTGELIPLTMANSSDVSIKMLFRKSDWK
jgi:hypothetical protein